jgi:aldose 1-epimerase
METLFRIQNNKGLEITFSAIGAGIVDIIMPDKNGVRESILVTPLNIEDYISSKCYFGKPTGRTAGRIENGEFELEGQIYKIKKAEGNKHALHGGVEGFAFKKFDAEEKEDENYKYLIFKYLSKDGEGGYPGNLKVSIIYRLSKNENKLRIDHQGTSDKTTLLNLTNHAYFNLSGNCKRNILKQTLYINSSKYGEVNQDVISTKIEKVDEVFDFKTAHEIGKYIESEECQKNSRGYDNPFLIDQPGEHNVSAFLLDEISGRYVKIMSSYECLVFYSTNYPDPVIVNQGRSLEKYDGCCLEFQHFPNGINSKFIENKKDILKKENEYKEFIEYDFCLE